MINKDNGFDLNIHWRFPGGREYAFAFISLLVFLLVIYANSFQGAFQFDDKINIVENRNIHLESLNWPNIKNTFYGINENRIDRPLAYLSFALNYYVHKLDVFGYHVINFTIHYFASIFLFLFIYHTLQLPKLRDRYGQSSYSIALLASLFWATSPVQVTAVTYIVQRMASMAGLLYIMAMYFYLQARTTDRPWKYVLFWSLCAFLAVLSLGVKENAVLLPVSIWLYDLLMIQGVTRKNLIRNLKVFVPAILTVALIALWYVDISSILSGAAYKNRPFTLAERLLTEPRVIIFYITLLLYPISSRLTLIHDIDLSTSIITPWSTLPAIALILIFIMLAAYISQKRPFIAFCILFFFLNHIIESTFIPLELIYEHRNYIPSMFFFVPMAVLMLHVIDYFSYKKAIQWTMAAVFIFLLSAQGHTVYLRNALFAHTLLLWNDNLAKTPTLSRIHNNLGAAYWDLGFYDKAYELFLKAESLDRQTNFFNRGVNLYNLGMYHLHETGEYKKAQKYFEASIEAYPGYRRAYHDAAICDMRMENLAKAGNRLMAALSKWPDDAYLRESLALVLLKAEKYDAAVKEARHALSHDSNLDRAMSIIAEAFHRKGNDRMATIYWERFIEKHQNDLEGNLALIELYSRQNKKEKLAETISKLMCLKESKSWDNLINQFLKDSNITAYTPSQEEITTLLRRHFHEELGL